MELKAKLVPEPKADAPSSSLARWLALDVHISLRVRGDGALFATDLSAFLSSPPILSLDILSVANKGLSFRAVFSAETWSAPCEALGGRPECQSKFTFKCILLTAGECVFLFCI